MADPVGPSFASTTASGVTSASAPVPLPAKVPSERVNVWASTVLLPLALRVSDPEWVTLPLSSAFTEPAMVATATMIERLRMPPKLPLKV